MKKIALSITPTVSSAQLRIQLNRLQNMQKPNIYNVHCQQSCLLFDFLLYQKENKSRLMDQKDRKATQSIENKKSFGSDENYSCFR